MLADGDKKIIAMKVMGTEKWFSVRNGYGFLNRNDTKEDVLTHQAAVMTSGSTFAVEETERLGSWMLLKEKRVQRQQPLQALAESQCKAVNKQQTVTITDAIHAAGVLHAIASRITRIVRVGERTRDGRVLLKARPSSAGPPERRDAILQGEVMAGADNQGAG